MAAVVKPLVLVSALCAVVMLVQAAGGPMVRAERHEGYYYPPLDSEEDYVARGPVLGESDRTRRIGFTVGMTKEQYARSYPPEVAVFAKGAEAEKLIIVALNAHAITTLYQARGLLAQMTSIARATPIFVENAVEDVFTFLDLLNLLGFEELTISDGRSYAHRINILPRQAEAMGAQAEPPLRSDLPHPDPLDAPIPAPESGTAGAGAGAGSGDFGTGRLRDAPQ